MEQKPFRPVTYLLLAGVFIVLMFVSSGVAFWVQVTYDLQILDTAMFYILPINSVLVGLIFFAIHRRRFRGREKWGLAFCCLLANVGFVALIWLFQPASGQSIEQELGAPVAVILLVVTFLVLVLSGFAGLFLGLGAWLGDRFRRNKTPTTSQIFE